MYDITKVAIIYHLDPSNDGKGGVVRYLNNLIRNLMEEEHIATTLIGVQITEQRFSHERFTYISIIKKSDVWWKYLLTLFLKIPFLKLPKDMVIHVHRIEYALPFAIFCKNNPLIYTIHGERLATAKSMYSPFAYMLINNIYLIYERLIFRYIDKILPVSNRVAESFEVAHPDISSKIKVISVGVNLSEFKNKNKEQMRSKHGFSENDGIVLYAGLLEKRKNLNLLINSFDIIHLENKNVKLIVVGRGPEQKMLKNLVENKKLGDQVTFMGEIERDELISLFICADTYALTSHSEGSPNVIKEALASGTPTVSTDVGDVGEIITNKNLGIVVKGYDEKEFADAILETIHHIKNNEILVSSECKKVADEFDVGNITREIVNVYNST